MSRRGLAVFVDERDRRRLPTWLVWGLQSGTVTE